MSDKIQRKTPRATLKQKIQVLDYLQGPPKRPQLETLSYFKTQNKFAISQATLSNWAINEYQLRKEFKDNPNLEDYKKKPVLKYPDVTLAVEKYIEQAFGNGQTITDKNIKDTFEKFLDKFGYKDLDFKLSAGMLHSFKKRNLITKGRFNIQNDDGKSEKNSIKSSETLFVPLPLNSSFSSSAPAVISSSNNDNNNNNNNNNDNNLDFNFDDIFNNPSIGFNTRLIHSDDNYSFLFPSMDNNLNDYSRQSAQIPPDDPSLYNSQQNNFNSLSSVAQQNLQLQSIPLINSSIEPPKLESQPLICKTDQYPMVPPDSELSTTTVTTTTTTTKDNINNSRLQNFESSPPRKHKLPFYPTYQHPLHHNSNQFKRHNPPFETLINPKLSNPNSEKVEKILENITEGNVTIYNSGTSAIMGILSYINPSSIFIDNLGYQGTHEVIKLLSKLTGLSKYSLSDLHKYDSHQLPPKSVIIIESPMNPLGLIHDLSYYSKISHLASSCHLIVDSTLAPPPLQFPFKFGADYIVYSAVKYLAGVSDLSAGFIVSRSKDDKIKLHKERFALGTSIANFDSFLLLRSLRTYKMRILTQCGNTEKILRFLIRNFKKYDNVLSRLHHSSLQPNQDCVKIQLNGYFNPVFALELKDPKYTEKLLRSFNFLSNNPNLEGGETLVELVCNNPNFKLDAGSETKLIRFSVGCEDYEDIIRDIDQALISIVKETV